MTPIRVILIEDDDLTRIGLRIALQRQKGIIFLGEASNGEEGLKLLQITRPDVAIVDIGLPDLDGIELTEQFKSKQNPTEPTTKILILTLQDDENSVFAAFAAGADSYCMKNINIELLLEALKTTNEGNTWIDPAIARLVLSQAQQVQTLPKNHLKNPSPPSKPNYDQILETTPLTERELQVLQLIVDGYSNAAIAEQLYITIGTVKTHVRNILNKLCADDRTQAAVRALRSGLVG
jgi:two-component system, NarL family, response regulator LiaR